MAGTVGTETSGCAGEGLVDLYTAMQPMIDKIIEERASQREEAAPKARAPGLAGEDETEGPQDMKIAVIGQPNVVRPHFNHVMTAILQSCNPVCCAPKKT